MDDSQFMLPGQRRHIDHPHTRNVPQRKSTPKSIHRAVVGPYSSLSFGDLPRDVVCPHEGSLANHVHIELITDNLLQEARDWAKLQLFGNADNNVQYWEAVKAAIIEMGHSYEFLYSDR